MDTNLDQYPRIVRKILDCTLMNLRKEWYLEEQLQTGKQIDGYAKYMDTNRTHTFGSSFWFIMSTYSPVTKIRTFRPNVFTNNGGCIGSILAVNVFIIFINGFVIFHLTCKSTDRFFCVILGYDVFNFSASTARNRKCLRYIKQDL